MIVRHHLDIVLATTYKTVLDRPDELNMFGCRHAHGGIAVSGVLRFILDRHGPNGDTESCLVGFDKVDKVLAILAIDREITALHGASVESLWILHPSGCRPRQAHDFEIWVLLEGSLNGGKNVVRISMNAEASLGIFVGVIRPTKVRCSHWLAKNLQSDPTVGSTEEIGEDVIASGIVEGRWVSRACTISVHDPGGSVGPRSTATMEFLMNLRLIHVDVLVGAHSDCQ